MVDNLTKKQRSYCMSRIRSKKTLPELRYKKTLSGFIYQPKAYGNPDFINYKKKMVVFIDGCFWHKCPKHYIRPKSNKKYWASKIERNIIRDKEVEISYKNVGWKIKRVWEHELN